MFCVYIVFGVKRFVVFNFSVYCCVVGCLVVALVSLVVCLPLVFLDWIMSACGGGFGFVLILMIGLN